MLDTGRIDRALQDFVEQGRVKGASVLVWQGGREAHFNAEGMADAEAGKPFARDTLVQIFSMTKPVTGVALMQLWEQGKFGLDDPLSRHLPQFAALQVYDGTAPDGSLKLRPPSRPVTVRDVLRHTAGFTYGQPFADYVAEHIFAPLGMTQSCWKCSADKLPRLAAIYESGEGEALTRMAEETWLEPNFAGKPMTMGGSGVVTTVDDYMRFARMLLGEGELDGARILQPATVRLMATDHLDPRIGVKDRLWLPNKGTGGFGFDFFVRTAPPQDEEENRGAVGEFFWDGYPSMLFWVDPANDMAVVFATQKVPFDGTLHHDIRDAVYGGE